MKKKSRIWLVLLLAACVWVLVGVWLVWRALFGGEVCAPPEDGGLLWNGDWCIARGEEPADKTEEWTLVLVNRWNPLDSDPEIELTQLSNGHAIDSRVYPQLQQMMDDARRAGLSPVICSSFRTGADQQKLYEAKVQKCVNEGLSRAEAEAEAETWVAVPGTSEHQTGLAVDIVSLEYQRLDAGQENTPEQKWLMENSWRYGFILRYPNGSSHVTGINYEPWHYRYVGVQAAEEIFRRGITLEEYLEQK